jgi:hypothetical protein
MTPDECERMGLSARASAESIWRWIDATSGTFAFTAATPDSDDPTRSTDWHTFYIKAVDDDGARSPADSRYFNAYTIAPTAAITTPLPQGADFATVPQYFHVRWTGHDEDAPSADRRPAGYQLKLIVIPDVFQSESVVKAMLMSPYNLAPNLLIPEDRIVEDEEAVTDETYLATDWYPKAAEPFPDDEWIFDDLGPGPDAYAFAIRAVDEAGAVTPREAFRMCGPAREGNFVKLSVESGPFHPFLTVVEEYSGFDLTFHLYGQEARFEPIVPLHFSWTVDASWYGEEPGPSTFALDIPDPSCEECTAEDGRGGWAPWGDYPTMPYDIVFGPEDAGEIHTLHIKARDATFDPDREMLAAIVMEIAPAFAFDKTALWVDDCIFPHNDPNDCVYEDFLRPILTDAIAPHLEEGEVLEQWQTHRAGAGGCTEVDSDPFEMELSRLARYRLLYWDVSNAGGGSSMAEVTDPHPDAEQGRYLSIYVRAGGRLIVWGRNSIGEMLGGIRPEGSYIPDLPIFDEAPWIYPGTFVWDVLRFRTEFDRVDRGHIPGLRASCSGMLGLEATQTAIDEGFPVGVPDPTGLDPSRVGIWIDRWYGMVPPSPAGESSLDVPTGVPPLHEAGLDTLYTFISNSWSYLPDRLREACGTDYLSPFEGKPIVMRYEAPSPHQGRAVWLGFPLVPFAENHPRDLGVMMKRLTDWVFEE